MFVFFYDCLACSFISETALTKNMLGKYTIHLVLCVDAPYTGADNEDWPISSNTLLSCAATKVILILLLFAEYCTNKYLIHYNWKIPFFITNP